LSDQEVNKIVHYLIILLRLYGIGVYSELFTNDTEVNMVTGEVVNEVQEVPQAQEAAKRERSTIVFPYGDLTDAISVAKGIHTVGGTNCQIDQLAAQLDHTVTSGAFQQRLNTARIFGLLTNSKGRVTLTPLGTRIVDHQQEKAAKVESFLSVPLYKKVYEHFKGTTLPPASGLDATIEEFGVSAKQRETARRAFQRSAMQAGFFEISQDRLTYPSMKGTGESAASAHSEDQRAAEGKRKTSNGAGGDGGDGTSHPLIEGLIKALPAPGEWPLDARRKWLQAAAMNFDFVYTDSTNTQGSIRVLLDKEASAN
jgi:hypothetical protein